MLYKTLHELSKNTDQTIVKIPANYANIFWIVIIIIKFSRGFTS